MVAAVDEKLVLEVSRRVHVLAGVALAAALLELAGQKLSFEAVRDLPAGCN